MVAQLKGRDAQEKTFLVLLAALLKKSGEITVNEHDLVMLDPPPIYAWQRGCDGRMTISLTPPCKQIDAVVDAVIIEEDA